MCRQREEARLIHIFLAEVTGGWWCRDTEKEHIFGKIIDSLLDTEF